jgi:hypothetical protein
MMAQGSRLEHLRGEATRSASITRFDLEAAGSPERWNGGRVAGQMTDGPEAIPAGDVFALLL